jgi:hypothetical protein
MGEAPIRDPYGRPWWSRQRWDRDRWLNVLFFAIVAGLLAFVAFAPQPALRMFAGNSGIGWWDRVRAMPGGGIGPELPEESSAAGPSGLVAAVAQLLQPDALSQTVAGLYETFVGPVTGTEPTTGVGNERSEAPPATDPQPTPPVPSPTTDAIPPGPTPTATDSPEPSASETSSPTPSDSPTDSPSPSDSPTDSPSPSDSPTDSPSPSDSPTRSPPPSRSPPPTGSPSPDASAE